MFCRTLGSEIGGLIFLDISGVRPDKWMGPAFLVVFLII